MSSFHTQVEQLDKLFKVLNIDKKKDETFVICGGLKDYTNKDGLKVYGLNSMYKSFCYEDGSPVVDKVNENGDIIPKEKLFNKAFRDKQKMRIGTKKYTFENAIKSVQSGFCDRIGLWIPRGYLVVDTDTQEASKIVGEYVKEKGWTNPIIRTKKGYHIFFKYDGDMNQMVAGKINLGCEVDYRVADKGYIVLPYNDPEREIKQIGEVEYITHKLFPVEERQKKTKLKKNMDTTARESTKKKKSTLATVEPLKDGDGRDAKIISMLGSAIKVPAMRDAESLFIYAKAINEQFQDKFDDDYLKAKVESIMNYAPEDYIDEKGKVIPYVLAKRIIEDYYCISDKISSYIYNGKSYEEIPSCYYNIIDNYISSKQLMRIATTTEVTSQIYKQSYRSTIENQRGYINFKNGIYDLENRTLIPHSKDIITLGVNNGNYIKESPSINGTRFEYYLKSSLTEDLIPVIQEMLGVCLYPLTDKIHYFYILTGAGRNGKGVLLNIIEKLIPENLRSGITMADYDTRFANSSIKGKQINLCMDDNTQRLEGIGDLKSVTAGEGIYAEKKGKDGEMIRAILTHISSFNELPSIREKAPALFDRMIVIPFNKRFGTQEEVAKGEKDAVRDPNLKEYIVENELDIIINWALQGLLRIIDNGYVFSTSKTSEEKKDDYITSVDSSLEWIKENVTIVEGLHIDQYIKGSQMYNHYKTWCKQEEKIPLGKQKFYDSIRVKLNSSWKNHNNTDKYSLKLKYIGFTTPVVSYYNEPEVVPF